jgi:hypothetical protein
VSLDTLRTALGNLPDGATLPVGWLREQLGRGVDVDHVVDMDFTLEQVGERLSRSPSTVRSWAEQGRFSGAYHLPASGKPDKRGRVRRGAWRIPVAALEALRTSHGSVPTLPAMPPIAHQRAVQPRRRPSGDARAQLGAWRHERPDA